MRGFIYKDLEFSQDNLQLCPGLCAVDNPKNVELTFKALQENQISLARMGAYKPRTMPHSFQGHGKACLPYVFELALQYNIKVICMEVTHEKQLDEINTCLIQHNANLGIIVQIGTRNAQNFELLKALGKQAEFPVLYKRGFGISLAESIAASEYLIAEGKQEVIFCLRGVKSTAQEPHRNLLDFSHISAVKRLTNMPVCIDPSHAVGEMFNNQDNITDIQQAAAMGVIAGANMVLVDFHPNPTEALVDKKQAIPNELLSKFMQDMLLVREAYLQRKKLWSN